MIPTTYLSKPAECKKCETETPYWSMGNLCLENCPEEQFLVINNDTVLPTCVC